jgi:hypothetical protein
MEAELTAARYDYLAQVLEDDFLEHYLGFTEAGILPYELLNIAAECGQLLDEFDFERNEDNRWLRYAILTAIADYLNE